MTFAVLLLWIYCRCILRGILMNINSRWQSFPEERKRLIGYLTEELIPLRSKAGLSQGDLAYLVGTTRQNYSMIELKKKSMSWDTYLSLIWFYDTNLETRDYLRSSPAYPAQIIRRINDGINPDPGLTGHEKETLLDLIDGLDDQALHTLRTLLLVEYARCKNIPGDTVVKSFEGVDFFDTSPNAATEQALQNIRKRR